MAHIFKFNTLQQYFSINFKEKEKHTNIIGINVGTTLMRKQWADRTRNQKFNT